jgi:hypothetical protein
MSEASISVAMPTSRSLYDRAAVLRLQLSGFETRSDILPLCTATAQHNRPREETFSAERLMVRWLA